jgi:hypothetical protein
MKALVARLVPGRGDKNQSFQAMYVSEEQRVRLIAQMQEPEVQAARPFRQGDNLGWMMIEFWVDNEEVIETAAKSLAKSIGVELKHGDFSHADVFGA